MGSDPFFVRIPAGWKHFRDRLEASSNLNDMAKTLKGLGYGMFDACPAGIAGPGITPVE